MMSKDQNPQLPLNSDAAGEPISDSEALRATETIADDGELSAEDEAFAAGLADFDDTDETDDTDYTDDDGSGEPFEPAPHMDGEFAVRLIGAR